jgi:YidC/Oxa1 family membrane protein insertase
VNDSKNLVFAIVLSALVLLGWSWVADAIFRPPRRRARRSRTASKPVPQPQAAAAVRSLRRQGRIGTRAHRRSLSTPRVRSRRPSLQGRSTSRARRSTICCWSAARDDRRNSPPVRLLSPPARRRLFRQLRLDRAKAARRPPTLCGPPSGRCCARASPVTLSWTKPHGLRFELRIAVDDDYLFTVASACQSAQSVVCAHRPLTAAK